MGVRGWQEDVGTAEEDKTPDPKTPPCVQVSIHCCSRTGLCLSRYCPQVYGGCPHGTRVLVPSMPGVQPGAQPGIKWVCVAVQSIRQPRHVHAYRFFRMHLPRQSALALRARHEMDRTSLGWHRVLHGRPLKFPASTLEGGEEGPWGEAILEAS